MEDIVIHDATSYCLDDEHGHRDGPPTGIAIHRFGVPGCHDACGVARFCRTEGTVGHKMSYGYVVNLAGAIEQSLPDDRWGWSSRASSRQMIAVAALGDFRSRAPHMPQWAGLTLLCCHLAAKYRISPLSVVGHDEIPGGSSDPDKQCPGRYLNMDFLRKSIDSDWLPR